jgi:hypothetical protein
VKKTLKQKLCLHDYVTVESMTTIKAAEKFVFENNIPTKASDVVYASPYNSNKVLYDKVCLKCEHCVSELTDFRNKMANMSQEELDKLEIQVRKMFVEVAARAAASNKRTQKARKIFKEYINGQKN